MSNTSLPVRPAELRELDAYVEHMLRFEAAWDPELDDLPYGPYDAGDPPRPEERRDRIAERWARSMREPGWGRALVAIDDARIVGHADLNGDGLKTGLHRCRLGLGIEHGHRGCGLGRRLTEAAIAWCRAEPQLAWLELGVFVGNDRARGLYQRLGFRSTGVVPDRFRVGGRSIDDEWMVLEVG